MVEKLEIIEDIETASREIEDGKGIPHDQAREMLLSRYTR